MRAFFAGIDLGSAFTKAVVITDDGKILGTHLERTGLSFETNAQLVFDGALAKAGLGQAQVKAVGATGVGRRNCTFATLVKPEIGCFAKGVYFHHRAHCVVVDIGGQDNKVIRVSQSGQWRYLPASHSRQAASGRSACAVVLPRPRAG